MPAAEGSLITAQAKPTRYPALDGLRAVAVLMVFFQHYTLAFLGLDRLGWIGVDIFFVLSGFLITGILYDSRNLTNRLRDFYMRRILRIFPLYYGFWLLVLLTRTFFHWKLNRHFLLYVGHLGNYARFIYFDPTNIDAIEVIANGNLHRRNVFAGLHIGHFWSLCVEEQFYLVWPAVVFSRLSRNALLRVCFIGLVAVLLLRAVLFYTLPTDWITTDFIYRFTWTRVDAFLCGGALALALRGPQREWLAHHWRQLVWPAHAVMALFYLWMIHTGLPSTLITVQPIVAIPGFTLVDLWAAALILHATQLGSIAYRVLNVAVLRYIGAISYGFYIFHFALIQTFVALGARLSPGYAHAGAALAAFLGTLGLSALSFRLYETPFLRLKAYFDHQTHKTPVAVG